MIELARWEAFVERVRGLLAPPTTGGDYVEVEGEVPLPMGVMFRDLLRQRGIPAMLRDSGVGRGALGGAPNLVRLMVPATYADQARWWLAPEIGLPAPAVTRGDLDRDDHVGASERGGGGDDARSEDDGER
jgi:hypothetical protein